MANYIDPNSSSLRMDARPGAVSRASWILLVAAVASVLFAVSLLVETIVVTNSTATTTASIRSSQTTLSNLQSSASGITALATQSDGLTTLFSNQKRWEVVLGNIQRRMYKKTVVTALSLSASSGVSITGLTGTYDDYQALYQSLTNTTAQAYFTNVKPVSVSVVKKSDKPSADEIVYPGLPDNPVSFTFSFTVTPAMYLPLPSS